MALALQKMGEQVEIENARAWLMRIAYNVCMDLHRERRRRGQVSFDDLGSSEDGTCLGECVLISTPEISLLKREHLRLLRDLISRLPERLRHTMELHALNEMSYLEVARHLGITEVNVRKRLQQARQILRKWKDNLPSDDPNSEVTVGSHQPGTQVSLGVISRNPAQTVDRDGDAVVALGVVEKDCNGAREVLLPLMESPSDCGRRRIAQLERYVKKHPGGWKKHLVLARVLCAVGRLSEAVPYYRYVLVRQPYPLAPWCELASTLQALGREDEAAHVLVDGARSVGRLSDRRHLEGLEAGRRGEWSDCRGALRDATGLDPEELRHWQRLGQVCLASGRIDQARDAIDRALALSPNDFLLKVFLCQARVGRDARAFSCGILLLHKPL